MEILKPKRKITGGGIQLADLQPNEIAFDEAAGLFVRKTNDGTALEYYGKRGAVNTADVTAAITAALVGIATEVYVDAAVASAGGGDMLAANNLSDLINAATARTNLDVRSTAQITTEIQNAVTAITLAGLGGLTQTEIDVRADARIAAQFNAAPAAYDNLQKIFAEMADDDTQATAILNSIAQIETDKIDVGGTIDGGTIL